MKIHFGMVVLMVCLGISNAVDLLFCCTEHNTMKLSNGAPLSPEYGLSKEECEQRCIDNPKCLASRHFQSTNECVEYTQTPTQAIDSTDYTAFLCRTRAMQVCTRHDGLRFGDSVNQQEMLTALPSGDTPESCHSECMTRDSRTVATTWVDRSVKPHGTPLCFCLFNNPPAISTDVGHVSFLCTNRIVSCKARLAKKTPGADKECERYDGLQLTAAWHGVGNANQYREHADMDEEACLRKCKYEQDDCIALTYHKTDRVCYELVDNVAKQDPQQAWNREMVSYLCY